MSTDTIFDKLFSKVIQQGLLSTLNTQYISRLLQYPPLKQIYLEKGKIQFTQGKFSSALSLFFQAILLFRYYLKDEGRLYNQQHQKDTSQNGELKITLVKILLELAQTFKRLGQILNSVKACNEVLKLEEDNWHALYMKSQLVQYSTFSTEKVRMKIAYKCLTFASQRNKGNSQLQKEMNFMKEKIEQLKLHQKQEEQIKKMIDDENNKIQKALKFLNQQPDNLIYWNLSLDELLLIETKLMGQIRSKDYFQNQGKYNFNQFLKKFTKYQESNLNKRFEYLFYFSAAVVLIVCSYFLISN